MAPTGPPPLVPAEIPLDDPLPAGLPQRLAAEWRSGSDGTVTLDLRDLGDLGSAFLQRLNDAYLDLRRAGWTVRVLPPDAPQPRTAFLRAAIRGDLAWG